MDANAVLGPVDPQIGDMPAASIVKASRSRAAARFGRDLILADIAQKARVQVRASSCRCSSSTCREAGVQVATVLTEGRWTHDFRSPCRPRASSGSRSRPRCRAPCTTDGPLSAGRRHQTSFVRADAPGSIAGQRAGAADTGPRPEGKAMRGALAPRRRSLLRSKADIAVLRAGFPARVARVGHHPTATMSQVPRRSAR